MRDAVVMWREPRLVVLVGVCAAVYAAAMIPFKFLIVFPGLAEVRPAAVLPIVFSFLFGPAGAWGSALGNVVGDVLGGMLGPGSIFGAFANFAYGYIPYKLWDALFGKSVFDYLQEFGERMQGWQRSARAVSWVVSGALFFGASILLVGHAFGKVDVAGMFGPFFGGRELGAGITLLLVCGAAFVVAGALIAAFSPVRFVLVVLVSCFACGGVLGWGVELLGFYPFQVFGSWIVAINFFVSFLLAGPILLLLYPRVAKRYMLYSDLLGEGRRRCGPLSRIGAFVVVVSVFAIFAAGVLIGPEDAEAALQISANLGKGLLISPLVAVFILGLFIL